MTTNPLDLQAPELVGASDPSEVSGVRAAAAREQRPADLGLDRTRDTLLNRVERFSGVAVLLLAWEVGPRLHWVDPQFFPPLSAIGAEGLKLASSGDLFFHIAASLARTLLGFSVASLVALPLGVALAGFLPRTARFCRALFGLLGQVHAFSLFPLFVLFFGIGEFAKFSVIFWSCFWPLLFGTMSGVRAVDPLLVKTARSMSCGRWTLIRQVLLPGALPILLTGVRLGATVAFLMLIAAEMMGAQTGLGWLVHNSQVNYIIPRLYLAAVVIASLGIGMEAVLKRLEAELVYWKPEAQP